MCGLVELRGEPLPGAGGRPGRLAVGVAADEGRLDLPEPVETLLRIRAGDHVAAADDPVDVERPHLGEHRLERGQVAVHIAEHGDAHLSRRRQCGRSARAAAQTRPGADDVERRTARTVELARSRHELAGADAADRLRELGLELG